MTRTAHAQRAGMGLLLMATMFLVALPISPTRAQDKKPAEMVQQAPWQAPGWSVQCDDAGKRQTCKATQSIILVKTHELLLAVSINKPAGSKSGAMLLQLPLGLYNPAGVSVAVDAAKPETLQIQTCGAKGCYAGAPLPPEKLTAFTKGTELNVVFKDLKKQDIKLRVPLKGFDEAFKKL